MTMAGFEGQAPYRHLCCRGRADVRTFRWGQNRCAKNAPHRGEVTARASGRRAAPGQCRERGEASLSPGHLRFGSDLGAPGASPGSKGSVRQSQAAGKGRRSCPFCRSVPVDRASLGRRRSQCLPCRD